MLKGTKEAHDIIQLPALSIFMSDTMKSLSTVSDKKITLAP